MAKKQQKTEYDSNDEETKDDSEEVIDEQEINEMLEGGTDDQNEEIREIFSKLAKL